ncbi:MAG: hypothetical protein QXV32_04760 [Conexivisphaerales archaeon]
MGREQGRILNTISIDALAMASSDRSRLSVFFLATLLISSILVPITSAVPQSSLPPYAEAGAFISYTSLGGFIPYFGGVSGDATYTITQVFTNGTMIVLLNETVSQGELGSITNVSTSKYYFDNAYSPSVFPALPVSALGESQVSVQGIRCNLTGQVNITVPAGTFHTYEYIGRDSNGTVTYYWFDQSSGVVVEMSSGVSAMQMVNSNIAFPISTPTPSQSELPYVIVVLASWGAMGALFLFIRRHYTLKTGSREPSGK